MTSLCRRIRDPLILGREGEMVRPKLSVFCMANTKVLIVFNSHWIYGILQVIEWWWMKSSWCIALDV